MQLDILDTQRLRLEPQCTGHAERLFELFQGPELHCWTSRGAPTELEAFRQACAFLEGRCSFDGREYWLNWVSIHKKTECMVGKVEISMHRETRNATIAYYTFGGFVRQGFAREGCQAVIEHAFTKWGTRVLAMEMVIENTPSIFLAEALGARRVGLRQNAEFFDGKWHDEYRYEIPHSERTLR